MCPETFNLWVIVERVLCRHQQKFSINVWAGIVGDYMVCPHVLPHRHTGNHYRDFLLHDLPKLMVIVTLALTAVMWYMHNGAPEHFSRAVWDVYNNTYRGRWIGRGRPNAWPPRSPGFESSGCLPVGTPINPCVCSSYWQRRGISPSHCGCLPDPPHLLRHLWTDVTVHGETCRGEDRILLRTLWALILNALLQ
jgi:hypothetical protein